MNNKNMSEKEISTRCRICGSEDIIATILVKAIIDGEEKRYFIHYCNNCWEDSLGEYIINQLKC